MAVAWLFAKEGKPYINEVVERLETHFELAVFQGSVGSPLPGVPDQHPSLVVSYLSPWILPSSILDACSGPCINFHPAPPEYPGIGCFNFALYDGVDEYGVTAHHMLPAVDAGAVCAVRRFPVDVAESVHSLMNRSYDEMFLLFEEVLGTYLATGEMPESTENWTRRPYTRAELDALGEVTCAMSAEETARRIRAVTFPGAKGAYLMLHGNRFEYADCDLDE